uniref:Tetraspanin n=1 Tax=Ascaris lumbricoides TaxID=6252 RepID=A0A0M3IIW7_ASCLU
MKEKLQLTGLAVIGLTLWLRLDNSIEKEIRERILEENNGNYEMNQIKEQIRFALMISFWVLCGFGLAGAIIGLIGSFAGLCGSRCTAGVYLALLIVMTVLEIGVGVFIIIDTPKIHDTVNRYVYIAEEMQSSNLQDANVLRQRFHCCGADGIQSFACSSTNLPTCTTIIWDRLNFTLMIAGIVLIGIVILQIISAIIAIALIVTGGRGSSSRPTNG